MSHNGVGLKTARGTGTSGHIQHSAADSSRSEMLGAYERRQKQERDLQKSTARFEKQNLSDRHVDEGILEHDRKREIEVKCMELSDKLEDEGVDEETVEEKVAALRKELTTQNYSHATNNKRFKGHEVHNMARRKAEENDRMKHAFDSSKPWRRGGRQPRRREYDDDDRPRHGRRNDRDRDRDGSKSPSRSRSRSPPPRREQRRRTRESRSPSRSRSPSPKRPDPRSRSLRSYE